MIRAVFRGGPADGCELGLAGTPPSYLMLIRPPEAIKSWEWVIVGAGFDDHWPGQQCYERASLGPKLVVYRHTDRPRHHERRVSLVQRRPGGGRPVRWAGQEIGVGILRAPYPVGVEAQPTGHRRRYDSFLRQAYVASQRDAGRTIASIAH
jgi:hypothetical protein